MASISDKSCLVQTYRGQLSALDAGKMLEVARTWTKGQIALEIMHSNGGHVYLL